AFGGYFSENPGSLLGNFDYFGFKDVFVPEGDGDAAFLVAFAAFQLTFAVITPALISGAVADRMKFAAWALFVPLWAIFVYSPVAHWVFGGGWLFDLGALDFAGGAVVHMNAGAAALALVLVLGKRRNWPREKWPPHSLPLTLLGTGILWFGWFGFNAGSALAANGLAIQAFINTFIAAGAAMIGWLIVEWLKDGKPTTLGAASGAVAGLVAITPCAGFVAGAAPIYIGLIAGALCFLAIQLKYRFGYDDSLDVVGVHLVGGLIGSILLGLFADVSVNSLGRDGLFLGGGAGLLGDQIVASVATLAYSFVVTFVLAKVIDVLVGIRVTEDDEQAGLDVSQHAETSYNLADIG
ncbi:MAG TPA: ammonium transporter, partial [Acidimicrobiales bacterium]|nr:ammonium transporter [Acidimicrobiales bacterium]